MMPFPCLPVDSAKSCSSHAPRSEIPVDVMMVTLSRPLRAAVPRIIPNTAPGFCSTGTFPPQARTISAVRSRNFPGAQSDPRRRHHAEIGEHGIAPADRRKAVKNVPEVISFGDLLHLRAGISNGHEMAPGFVRTDCLLGQGKEMLLENVWFEGAARFT